MSAKRKARPKQTSSARTFNLGTCPLCGKQTYRNRKDAKQAMRTVHQGDHGMSVYPCGDGYHFGHLSSRVKSGDTDRRDLRRGLPE